jgi:hypothetical protein
MWIRSWRRLAGYIANELAVAGLAAAQYGAGTGMAPSTRALALGDGHGGFAIIAQTDFLFAGPSSGLERGRKLEVNRAG